MKKIILLIFLAVFMAGSSYAQSPTAGPTKAATVAPRRPTATPTLSPDAQQIEKIKDLVASKVAELNLVDKRGILGKVKSRSNTQIILMNVKNKEIMIDIDELTKFEGEEETFGISDIKATDNISAVGLFNKDTERLLARYVSYASNIPENFSGVVTERDEEEFTLTVVGGDGKQRIIDVQTSTKTLSFEEGDLVKSGFSKTEVGERVIVVGFADTENPEQINASRLVRLPGIPLSSELKSNLESEDTGGKDAESNGN